MYSILKKKRKNSKHYTEVVYVADTAEGMADVLRENDFVIGEKPYVFTHIPVSQNDVDYIVVCRVQGTFLCSLTELYEILTK